MKQIKCCLWDLEMKEIPLSNIEADDSSIVSEILKKYKN